MRKNKLWFLPHFALMSAAATAQVLNPIQVLFEGVGIRGASCVVVSPDGLHAYVCGASSSSLTVFRRNPVAGSLEFVQRLHGKVGSLDGLERPVRIAISPDGLHVYVASAFDGLAVFARDRFSGGLTLVEVHRDGQDGVDGLELPVALRVSPDGEFVYAVGHHDRAAKAWADLNR